MKTSPSTTLGGRYVLLELVGSGGMGTVHAAYDESLRRPVAVKTLRLERLSDEARARASARLLREARSIAALSHPNIVSIFDVLVEEGSTYVVMELCSGGSLRKRIGATPSNDERIGWLHDIAHALAYAHERGFVHRDIKPENVLLGEGGRAKVVDFGTARVLSEFDALGSESARAPITLAGKMIGTPEYMAPEQYESDALDPASDQFAWGIVAYELLAGRHPWSTIDGAPSPAEVLALGHRPRPLAELAPGAPAGVVHAVERAMEREVSRRFPDMNALIAALDSSVSTSARSRPSHASAAPPEVAATQVSAQLAPTESSPRIAPTQSVEPSAPTRVSKEAQSAARPPRSHPPAMYGSYAPPRPLAHMPLQQMPRRPGTPVGIIIGVVAAAMGLGACGLCVGLGAIGAAHGGARGVQVSCEGAPANGYVCSVAQSAGSRSLNACWDMKVTCANGVHVTGHACQTVNARSKAVRKVLPGELSNALSCTQPQGAAIENVKSD